jgi:hypothetical protein
MYPPATIIFCKYLPNLLANLLSEVADLKREVALLKAFREPGSTGNTKFAETTWHEIPLIQATH